MFALLFIIIGTVLAWLTIYMLGFKKIQWKEFLLGMGAFFLAMFLQSSLQHLPLFALDITSNQDIVLRGLAFTVGTTIWLGLIAGIVQEGVKYILVRGKNFIESDSMGFGFGISEVVMVILLQIIISIILGTSIDPAPDVAFLSMMERYFAILFHVATTVFLTCAYLCGFGKIGLVSMMLLHGLIDSMASYYRITQSIEILYIVEGSFAIVTSFLFYYVITQVSKRPIFMMEDL